MHVFNNRPLTLCWCNRQSVLFRQFARNEGQWFRNRRFDLFFLSTALSFFSTLVSIPPPQCLLRRFLHRWHRLYCSLSLGVKKKQMFSDQRREFNSPQDALNSFQICLSSRKEKCQPDKQFLERFNNHRNRG